MRKMKKEYYRRSFDLQEIKMKKGVPLEGMQSIRRALVGLPLRFSHCCIEEHWQRLLLRNR